jgi:hypothetical protein
MRWGGISSIDEVKLRTRAVDLRPLTYDMKVRSEQRRNGRARNCDDSFSKREIDATASRGYGGTARAREIPCQAIVQIVARRSRLGTAGIPAKHARRQKSDLLHSSTLGRPPEMISESSAGSIVNNVWSANVESEGFFRPTVAVDAWLERSVVFLRPPRPFLAPGSRARPIRFVPSILCCSNSANSQRPRKGLRLSEGGTETHLSMRQARYSLERCRQSVDCCLFCFMHLRYRTMYSLHSPARV